MTWGPGCPQLPPADASLEACTWSANQTHYKQLQKLAYINHDGANASAVVAMMLIYPLTVLLQSFVADVATRISTQGTFLHIVSAIGEFTAAVIPLTCAFTSPQLVWNSLLSHLLVCAFFAAYSKPILEWPRIFAQMRAFRAARRAGTAAAGFTFIDEKGERLRFVSEYRAVIMITTCIAILAVDFPALFSRTHGKTEEFGFSLMDLGTGSIVVATAICSKTARGSGSGSRTEKILRQTASLRPILILGFIRFIVLWGIDYHVPTSEYGVHWNFFFTIAVLSFVSTAADLSPRASAGAGTILLLAYQVFLSMYRGQEYILHAPRVGPFSANREGIFSCAGFLGIHWLGVALGADIKSTRPANDRSIWLLCCSFAGLVATATLSTFGFPVSRRMCNLPYATFILGVNAMVLGLLSWIDLEWPRPRPQMPLVYAGVQDSMFAAFIIGNLLTGMVNVLFQPLLIPARVAMIIMLLYTVLFTLPFHMLRARGVVLKFW